MTIDPKFRASQDDIEHRANMVLRQRVVAAMGMELVARELEARLGRGQRKPTMELGDLARLWSVARQGDIDSSAMTTVQPQRPDDSVTGEEIEDVRRLLDCLAEPADE